MNIIFGDAINNVPDSYTVLELDTFRLAKMDQTFTAWCVVDAISLNDFPVLDQYREMHSRLISAYKQREWNVCNHLIDELTGKWKGSLDSFYEDLAQRIRSFETNPPGPEWDGVVERDDD